VLLLALALPAAPADRWVRVRSAHFELFTEGGEAGGRDLVQYFEQVHSFFRQAFDLDSAAQGARLVRIVCFRSPKEFERYESSRIADGAFHAGSAHDYIVMKNSAANRNQMAVHEYTHLVLRHSNQEIPVWLDEGLAEVYSNLEARGSAIVVGQPIPGRVAALERGRWIDLRTLVSASRASPVYNDKSSAEMFYAESWALVHMLALDNAYSPRLKSLLYALPHSTSVAALENTYAKPIARVEADLRVYMERSQFNAAVFAIRLPESEPAPQVKLQAGLEARLALAELLLDRPGRTAEARAAFEQAVHDYPKRAEAEQGLGELLAHERREREAAAHFARAAALGDTDARMFVEYGRVLSLMDRPEDAAAALRKAVTLDPALDDAHFELALLLVKREAFGEAIDQFRLVKKLPPAEAPRYYYHLAYAHYKLGQVDQARLLAQKAKPVTRNPDEVERLNSLLRALDSER